MPGERYEVSWQPRRGADRIFRNIEAGSFLEASIKCAELRGIKKVVNNKEGGQMKACFHKATCKYFNEELDSGECACVVVCKFYVGMDFDELKKKKNKDTPAKEKHKKRHYARRAKKEAEEKKRGRKNKNRAG